MTCFLELNGRRVDIVGSHVDGQEGNMALTVKSNAAASASKVVSLCWIRANLPDRGMTVELGKMHCSCVHGKDDANSMRSGFYTRIFGICKLFFMHRRGRTGCCGAAMPPVVSGRFPQA
jgi:hypothetical protein